MSIATEQIKIQSSQNEGRFMRLIFRFFERFL